MLKGIALSTLADYLPTTEDVRALAARGCTALRLELTPDAGPGPLSYLHHHSGAIGGMKLVALIGQALLPHLTSSDWNSSGAHFEEVLRAWSAIVTDVLRAAAGSEVIDYVEIMNEPNDAIGPGRSGVHPENYAHLYRAAHDVLAGKHLATKVISGGLFAHADSAAGYLHAVRKVLPINFNYVGWHPYLDSGGGLQTARLDAYIRKLYAAFGKPLFITEAGWSTSAVSQEVQASNLASLFATARATTLVEGVLAFTLDDSPEAQPALHFGIRNKQAWQEFRNY